MSKDNKSKTVNKSGTKQQRNIIVQIGIFLVLVLVVVAFIFVPAMSQSGSSSDELVFGKYGDTQIDYVPGNYFARQIEYINNVYRDSDTLSDNVEYKRQLVWQTAFNQTVIQKAIEENLSKSGVLISETQIDKAMVERGPFQVDGNFSEELYRNASSSTKFDLRKQFKEDLLREQYLTDVMYGSRRSNNLITFIANLGSEEKSFNYAIFNSDNIDSKFFTAYASTNLDKFSKSSLNKITIFSSEEDAKNLQLKIIANEISFKEAAIAESKDSYAAEGGNAGEMYFHELLTDAESEEASNAVFALKDKEITDVITTSYGWVIYQMVNAPVMPDLTSEDVINDVKVYMSRNEKGLIEDYLVSQGTEFSNRAADSDFLSTAISMSIENGTTDYFSVNYGNNRMIPSSITNATQQNPAFSSAAFDELFLERLFALENTGDVSDPLVLGSNIVVAELSGMQKSDKIPEESMEYYKYQVESEIAGYMQSDLQNLVLASDTFENNFILTYAKIFYSN
jgi:peptidyl-prolyl cis-trans isomerase D